MVNFTLNALSDTGSMTVSASPFSVINTAIDATAILYVSCDDMKSMFQFQTDSNNFSDLSNIDIKYYINNYYWPLISSANAMMDQTLSQGAISTRDKYGYFASNKMLLSHDYIRYLSYKLFNTPLGVDLFINKLTLIQNIRSNLGNVDVDINSKLNAISINGTSTNLLGTTGSKYLTNAVTDNTNLCRELLLQLYGNEPTRFTDISNIHSIQSVPFQNNDTISYSINISAAPGQEALTGILPIPDRKYEIKLVLVDASLVTNTVVLPEEESYKWTQRSGGVLPTSAANWYMTAVSGNGKVIAGVVYGGSIYTGILSNNSYIWTQQSGGVLPSTSNWRCIKISNDGSRIVACANSNYVYTALLTSGSYVWTKHSGGVLPASSANWSQVAISLDGNRLIAGITGGNIYTALLTSGSYVWTKQIGGVLGTSTGYWNYVAISGDGNRIAAVYTLGTNKGIYTALLTNGSYVWTKESITAASWAGGIALSNNGSVIVTGVNTNPGPIYIGTLVGSSYSWTQYSSVSPGYWQSFAISNNGTQIIAAMNTTSNSNIYTAILTNGVYNWIKQTDSTLPSGIWLGVGASSDGTRLIASTYNGYIYTAFES